MEKMYFKVNKNLLIVYAFIFCFWESNAQNIIWNPNVKIADRVYQQYLGSLGRQQYCLGSNIKMTTDDKDSLYPAPAWKKLKLTMFRYDEKFNLIDTVPIRFFQFPLRYFNATLNDSVISLYYSKGFTSPMLCVDIFDHNGFYKESKTLLSSNEVPGYLIKRYFNIFFSPDQKNIVAFSNDSISCYTKKWEVVWKVAFKTAKFITGIAADDFTFCAVVKVEKENCLLTVNTNGTIKVKKLPAEKPENTEYRLLKKNDKIYCISLYGITDKTFKPEYDKISSRPRFRSNGIEISTFVGDDHIQQTKHIPFTDETLLASVERMLIQNIKGIDFVHLTQVSISDDDALLMLLSKEYDEPTPARIIQGSKVEIEGRLNRYQEIIVIKCNDDGKNYQNVIKRKVEGNNDVEYLYNVKGIPSKGDFFVYYQDGNNEIDLKLNQLVYNKDLRLIFAKKINLVEAKKTGLNLESIKRVDNANYIVFGRSAKKFSSALLDFK
jgi:hypothetical protein